MYKFLVFFFTLCLSICNTYAAGSADPIETVIVSGMRSETASGMVPGSITVISADDIQKSGATHLIDVLRNQGGLQISDLFGDGTDASVGLRGFSSTAQQNTLILVDGRRLNNADNGLPDLNTVALSNIEQIEIVKGSQGALYGDKAVGGVIHIISRKPEDFSLQLRADYGSYDHRALYANLENSHDNGIRYHFSAQRRLRDNYRDNNALQLTDISSKIFYDYSSGELFLEYQHVDENIHVPGALFRDQVGTDRRQAQNPDDFIDTDTGAGRLGIRQKLGERIEIYAEYTNRLSKTEGKLSSGGNPALFSSKRHHLEYTPRIVVGIPMPSGDAMLTVGADLFRTEYFIGSDFGITDNDQTQNSYYLQALIPLTEHLLASIGGRHGRVENDILVDTLAFGRSLPAGTRIDDSANAWEAGLSLEPWPGWRVYARVDRNFRFVTADEYSAVADNNLFSNLFAFGTIVPLPQTQTGLSYELGAEWTGQKAGGSLQFYQLELNNEIVFNPLLFLNTNINDTRRRGLIAEGRYAMLQQLEFRASYSYIDATVSGGPFAGEKLTFIPEHSSSVSASYRYNDHVHAYLELVGVSERINEGDFFNAFSALPGYLVANLKMSFDFDALTLSARVNNLFDKEYSDAGNISFDFRAPFPSPQVETFFPAPGRNFMFSLQYSYR